MQISNTQTDRLVVSLRGPEQVVQLSLPAEKKVKLHTDKGIEPGGRQESDCGSSRQIRVIQYVFASPLSFINAHTDRPFTGLVC